MAVRGRERNERKAGWGGKHTGVREGGGRMSENKSRGIPFSPLVDFFTLSAFLVMSTHKTASRETVDTSYMIH